MTWSCPQFISLLVVLCATQAALAQVAPRYRVTDLGDFGYSGPNEVEALNDLAQVVGWQIADAIVDPPVIRYLTHGYFWSGGQRVDLRPPPGAAHSWATDVNNAGVIVGRALSDGAAGASACFFDRATGAATPILLAGATARSASAVSDTGLVAGVAIRADGTTVPFVFDQRSGAERYVADLPGPAVPLAVNDDGAVVGIYTLPGGVTRPFLSLPGAPAIDLNTLLPAGSAWQLRTAVDVNRGGVIVGDGVHAGQVRAFRGRFDGSDPQPLAPLPGEHESHVAALNDGGLAVGYSYYFVVPAARWTGVVWTADEVLDVNSRLIDAGGMRVEGIRAVNARGHLAVRGVASDVRQFLLTPVCAEDLDENGWVELADLTRVLACFGRAGCEADVNADGRVDLEDVNRVLARFGTPCP